MNTQNNIFESMLKCGQKTSVSNVNVASDFTNKTYICKQSYEVCIAHYRSYMFSGVTKGTFRRDFH